MSHVQTYMVMVTPRQSAPKRVRSEWTIQPVESSPDPNTKIAAHDGLLADEELYIINDGTMEPSTGEYPSFAIPTLSQEVGPADLVHVPNNNRRL